MPVPEQSIHTESFPLASRPPGGGPGPQALIWNRYPLPLVTASGWWRISPERISRPLAAGRLDRARSASWISTRALMRPGAIDLHCDASPHMACEPIRFKVSGSAFQVPSTIRMHPGVDCRLTASADAQCSVGFVFHRFEHLGIDVAPHHNADPVSCPLAPNGYGLHWCCRTGFVQRLPSCTSW